MEFILGCNYWASHAGTEMWREWNEDIVRSDLQRLASYGVTWLRVFPNWRDFQPVKPLYTGQGKLREFVNENDERFDNPYYLNNTMVSRFVRFCEIAEECGCKLIVGLITGWMSGRLFVPPALYGVNVHEDLTALLLQQKYCKGMVTALRDLPAIAAWDLGNECNCMSDTQNRDAAANWTSTVSNAIRSADPTRPIVSGMHSLTLNSTWTIADQAEHTDILTTHPYPHWVPHCSEDPIGSIRTLLHATAESVYYRTVGGKPCLAEEIGTMGPMICSDKMAADFLRVNLFSNWANGQLGVMWWCAHEQNALGTAPYRWNMCERELGMLDKNLQPKPVLLEMKKFADFMQALPYTLPAAKTDGVCILTQDQDHWGIVYMSYILAKQAGASITFCNADDPIPDAPYYLLPSTAVQVMDKQQYDTLKANVRAGAKLYISNDNGFLTEFEELTGLHILDSENAGDSRTMHLGESALPFHRTRRFLLEEADAQVLARDDTGMPCFTVHKFGEGEVYYLNFPLEKMMINKNNAFAAGHYRIYRRFFRDALEEKIIRTKNPFVGITEHPAENGTYAVLVNYSGETQAVAPLLKPGCRIARTDYGNPETLAPYEAAVLYLEHQ